MKPMKIESGDWILLGGTALMCIAYMLGWG
jgi:hypothetical protein